MSPRRRWLLRGAGTLAALLPAAQIFPVGATDGRTGLSALAAMYESAAHAAVLAYESGARVASHAQLAYQLLNLSGRAQATAGVAAPAAIPQAPAARPLALCKGKAPAAPRARRATTALHLADAEIRATLAGLFSEGFDPELLRKAALQQEAAAKAIERSLRNDETSRRILIRVLRPSHS